MALQSLILRNFKVLVVDFSALYVFCFVRGICGQKLGGARSQEALKP